ncbi:MAG TPA: MerR family transcriptional regulator [Ktedonobacterales bacterium]
MHETPGVPLGARDAREANAREANARGEGARERQFGEGTSGLSIEELADVADLPVRTIRYYIAEGLLPGPGSRGKQATYGEDQLVRLQLIRRLAERRVPLAQMRKLLAQMRLEDVRTLLAEEEQSAAELARAERKASPKEYVAGLLQQARAMREAPRAPGDQAQSGQSQLGQSRQAERARSSGVAPSTGEVPRLRSSGPLWRSSSPELPAGSPPQSAEAWQRWELAPGIELQVRADAARKYRALIRRVLAAAREASQEVSQEGRQDEPQDVTPDERRLR